MHKRNCAIFRWAHDRTWLRRFDLVFIRIGKWHILPLFNVDFENLIFHVFSCATSCAFSSTLYFFCANYYYKLRVTFLDGKFLFRFNRTETDRETYVIVYSRICTLVFSMYFQFGIIVQILGNDRQRHELTRQHKVKFKKKKKEKKNYFIVCACKWVII